MSVKSALLVFIQFLCLILLLTTRPILAHNYLFGFQILSFIIALWGVFVMRHGRFNIHPEVKETAKLITKGPYKFIRNPMYSGTILFFLISVGVHFSYYRMAVLLILISVLILKILSEEYFLAKKFGTTYLAYKSKTKRLIPYIF